MKKRSVVVVLLLLLITAIPGIAKADMLNYCMTPAFLQAGILPNLLFVIDNSASMFDLTYVDMGLKHCSNSADTCTTDSQCGAGTCTVFDRQPMYCYDETYRSTNVYVGYYNRFQSDGTTKQYYNYDFTTTSPTPGKFDPVNTFSCTAGGGETALSITNELCVIYNPALAGSTKVTKFLASGNYLNWLTASKSDVQKQILTGGRYNTGDLQLLAESRGCVGQGFIKQPLTADFVNFAGGATNDTNTPLKVTFRVHGPVNTNNQTAPSQGGGTRIDIFISSSTYNYKACQDAVTAMASGTNAEVKLRVGECLATTALEPGQCKFVDPVTLLADSASTSKRSCSTSGECKLDTTKADSAYVCSANINLACTGTTDVTTCTPAAINVCDLKRTLACTTRDSCVVTTPSTMGTCGNKSSYTPTLPINLQNNSSIPGSACTTAANCRVTDNQGRTYDTACNGYSLESTTDYGECINTSPNYGTCVANYFGECVLPSATIIAKNKIAFSQSLQACWSLKNGTPIGTDEYLTIKNQCPDVFGGVANGPNSILSGSYGLICGSNYAGQMYSQSAAGQPWLLRTTLPASPPAVCSASASAADPVQDCIIKIHTQFCTDTTVTNVTDPTDDPSNTTLYGNIPAILSGIGVEAQLGVPLATDVRARVNTVSNPPPATLPPPPTGLIQDFGTKIRMGVMSFNYDGSLAEVTAMAGKKYCSNNSSTECTTNSNCPTEVAGVYAICTPLAAPKVCSNTVSDDYPTKCVQDIDCGSGNTCVAATNRDGSRILSYIAKGHCSATTTTSCAKDAHCPSGETCVYDGVGDHSTGLVKTLDDLKSATWTPFAEAFYNALGYFAIDKDRNAAYKYSRADTSDSANNIRLNASDFSDVMNPSQFSCQQNNILLISDGMSSMDQNTTVNTLAGLYHATSNQTGACTSQFGSKNLDDMAYLAKNYNINEFLLDGGSTPGTTLKNNEFINTYVVFNGDTNGLDPTDECNSETLLSRTAVNGGTTLYKAINPTLLRTTLKTALDDISAKVSSGTAAAVANNKSGERGANIIQALFYPKWPSDFSKQWLGDIQALWFYVDPIVKFSGIYEDTDEDYKLNLAADRSPGNDSLTVKALWKAGELLHGRAASDRTIYTLLDSTKVLADASDDNKLHQDNYVVLKPLMDISALAETPAKEVINYVRGSDGTLRSRKVTQGSYTNQEWKLGDVINSTPQIQGNDAQNKYDIEYGDFSYGQFTKSTNYKGNNTVFAGSNDGMMHAFKLGQVSVVKDSANPFKIAEITDTTDIGKEMWGFIPKNALPYLKNCADPNYCHQFLVDGAPLLFDASINKYTGCTPNNYWECPRKTTLPSNALDGEHTSWRSILLGSMGLGGATRNLGVNCNRTHATSALAVDNNKCINTPVDGVGYSSYFALDVTTPATPTLLWEFSDASIDADPTLDAAGKTATKGLGLTTPGGIQLRINSRVIGTPAVSDKTTNGRWFAVFPSGPTGPIDTGTHQFMGESDQNLKIYIVDLNPANGAVTGSTGAPVFRKCTSAAAANCNYWVKDTGIKFAFANSLFNAAVDIDKGNGGSESNYSDDVVYITYTKASLDNSASPGPYPTVWDKGGVLRLITNNDPDPYNWFTSKLIDDIGPVTRSVDLLQDKNNNKLWVFFGEARYFFRQDDLDSQRRIFGVADPCYSYDLNSINKLSTTLDRCPSVNLGSDPVGNLTDQSGAPSAELTATKNKGWFINLEAANATYAAERLSGGISSRTNGLVLFTTFIPSMDPCDAGGLPSQWAVNYRTGGAPPSGSLQGKVIMTTSDSPIAKTINLAGAFTQRDGRKLAASLSAGLKGMPPPSPPPSLILPSPSRKILQIQER